MLICFYRHRRLVLWMSRIKEEGEMVWIRLDLRRTGESVSLLTSLDQTSQSKHERTCQVYAVGVSRCSPFRLFTA